MAVHELGRHDHFVTTRDGVRLRVRTLLPAASARATIVLVHGISAPLVPTYDLAVPTYSFMETLAARGYRVVAFDHRNFGGSDRAPEMTRPPVEHADGRGVHTLDDSVEDIRAVIADCAAGDGAAPLILFGSSRGALQVLEYAAAPDPGVAMVIMNNPSRLAYLAGCTRLEVPALAGEHAKTVRTASYIVYTADHQRARWKQVAGDSDRVDRSLQDAYIQACIDSDPDSGPGVFRVPTESIPTREPLVALDSIRVPILVTEAEQVPADDQARFLASLPAGLGRIVTIADSDHFTLRNEKRFELANILDAAITGLAWGTARGSR